MAVAVPLTIRKIIDEWALIRQSSASAACASWTKADASDDEDFENHFSNQALSDFADLLDLGISWKASEFRTVMDNLQGYLYGHVTPALALPYLASYLTQIGFRVPWHFAESYYDAYGSRIPTRLVFPKGTMTAADVTVAAAKLHKFGTLTGTAGASTYASEDGALTTTKIIGAPVLSVAKLADPGNAATTVTCTLQDGTTKALITGLAAEVAWWKHSVPIGRQAIVTITLPDKYTLAATAQFKAGEYVLLWENSDGVTSIREVAQVKAVTGAATFTVEFMATPKQTFTNAGFIIPMFTNVALGTGNLTDGKTISFYALPDRILAL